MESVNVNEKFPYLLHLTVRYLAVSDKIVYGLQYM